MTEALRSSGVVGVDAFGSRYEEELREGRDPWESLRQLRAAVPDLSVHATISGAGLLRLEPVADDVVELFVRHAVEAGVDAFRIYDPLNDTRNVEVAVKAVRGQDRRAHGQLCFAMGPPYTTQYWRDLAASFVELGCEALIVNDAGWQLEPENAAELARDLQQAVSVPVVVTTAGSVSALHMMSALRAGSPQGDDPGVLTSFFEEFAQVRADLGYPPLAPEVATIVAQQAIMNIGEGARYRTVTHELKEYLHGRYGRPPAEPDPALRRQLVGQEMPITVRPGRMLPPGVPTARAEVERLGITGEPGIALSFCLFPDAARAMLRQRQASPETPAAQESEQGTGAAASEEAAPEAATAPPPTPSAPQAAGGEFDVEVDGEVFRVRVAATGAANVTAAPGMASSAPAAPARTTGTAVVAPMQGLLVKLNVKQGDEVKMGDVVAVLEAMKMQNDIVTTVAGKVSSVAAKQGDVVAPNQPLVFIQ